MSSSPTPHSAASLSRQQSGSDIRTTVRDYISSFLPVAQVQQEHSVDADGADTDLSTGYETHQPQTESTTTDSNIVMGISTTAPSAGGRHLHLPPIAELESYVLDTESSEDASENILNVLPDIAEAIASYVRTYPEQVPSVWRNLKPILRDIRRRNRLHGRNIIRPPPPVCPKYLSSWTTCHGDEITDDYAWLRDRENAEVMRYLEAENAYSEASLAHTKTLQTVLYKEFISRLNENEESARVNLSDGLLYFTRKLPGAEYRVHCRSDRNGIEEIYFDENALHSEFLANNCTFFHLGFLRHSPDCQLIAYGIDLTGSERYTAYFKNLQTQETLHDVVSDCYEDFEFSDCGKYAFYILIDDFERAYQLKRHEIGTDDSGKDVVLYEEKDEMFCLTMTKSSNKRYLILNSSAQVTSETWILDLSKPLGKLQVLFPRREKVQYTIEHHFFAESDPDSQEERGYFYVMTNEKSKNMQLFRIPTPKALEWSRKYQNGIEYEDMMRLKEIVIESRDFVLIEAFQIRTRHLIVFERSNCMQNIRVVSLDPDCRFENYHYVSFSEGTVYSIWPGSVDEEVADLSKSVLYDTNLIRFTYTSFTQPKQVIDYNMDLRQKTVVHEEQVSGPGFDPDLYTSKRLWATSEDGTAVPISLVYRRDLLRNANLPFSSYGNDQVSASSLGLGINATMSQNIGSGTAGVGNPLLLHGYGAYGCCVDPIFNASRLSLLDRGFIYAVAHVRGGSDMGNGWYEEGKMAKKPNTFKDFISCAEYLVKEGYTSKEKLAIYGRSAGGLLIGAAVNARPDLFKAVLTEVPFVDVINTMFDSSIPWTAFEYEEWGNPADENIYEIMKTYCPYTNIRNDELYPNMLIVGGMNDPRVAYFEPAKWTAKLRALARWPSQSETPLEGVDHLLLLKIQDTGHSGSSGQYSYLEDLAFEYAFLISTLGVQFRPVGSGHSKSGVDYDMYWQELEYDVDDEEEIEEGQDDAEKKPSTPLQRFSDYWKRRNPKRTEKKPGLRSQSKERRPRDVNSKASSRSVSIVSAGLRKLSLRRNLGHHQSETEQSSEIENIEGSMKSLETAAFKNHLKGTTPKNGKALPRHQFYLREDETGRVQGPGKIYNFLSKFF